MSDYTLSMRITVPVSVGVITTLLPLSVIAAFSDVPSSHSNSAAINYVQQQGIVQGYPDGTYGPSKTINRAEFTKILIGARYSPVTITSCTDAPFGDTPDAEWFSNYVCVAFNQGIIGGYADGTFKPTNNVNMGEAAKIIVRAFDLPPVPVDSPALDLYRSGFAISGSTDEKLNPYWWQYYLVVLNTAGALPSTYRSPDQAVTRAEMAEMIYRVKVQADAASSVPAYIPSSSASSVWVPPVSSSRMSSSAASQVIQNQPPEEDEGYVLVAGVGLLPVTSGDPFLAEFEVKNYGENNAEDVVLILTIDKPQWNAAVTDTRCVYIQQNDVENLRCNLGRLNPSEKTRVVVGFKTNWRTCPFTMSQSAHAQWGDEFDRENSSSGISSADIVCPPAQQVWLSPSNTFPSSMQGGTTQTFSYIITNNAETASAYSVKAIIDIPSGTSYVQNGSSSTCTLENGDVVCSMGIIGPKSQAEVFVNLQVSCVSSPMETSMTFTTTSQNKFAPSTVKSSTLIYCQ